MNHRIFILSTLLGGMIGAESTMAADVLPKHLAIQAKVRDFKENNPTDPVNTHPHFNTKSECSAQKAGINTVKLDIATNDSDDDRLFDKEDRGPRLILPVDTAMGDCFDPVDRFQDWFQDKGPDINRSFRIELLLTLDSATGIYQYTNRSFFPIDNGASFSKFHAQAPDPFGHLQTGFENGVGLSTHNYGFTMEIHSTFQYRKGLTFYFEGDDDIWVFMNGKRVLDMGGLHLSEAGTVNLDDLNLENGKVYPLDLFFAERRSANSSFTITTNLMLVTKMDTAAAPKITNYEAGGPVPAKINLSSVTPGATIYYTTDGSKPDTTKIKYTDSIPAPSGLTLKAIAFVAGLVPSEVLTTTFPAGPVSVRPSSFAASQMGGPGVILVPGSQAGMRISLHDHQGKMLRVLASVPSHASGFQAVQWDGKDASGRLAPLGIYFWKTAPQAGFPAQSGMVVAPR